MKFEIFEKIKIDMVIVINIDDREYYYDKKADSSLTSDLKKATVYKNKKEANEEIERIGFNKFKYEHSLSIETKMKDIEKYKYIKWIKKIVFGIMWICFQFGVYFSVCFLNENFDSVFFNSFNENHKFLYLGFSELCLTILLCSLCKEGFREFCFGKPEKNKELERIKKYCKKALKTKGSEFNILLHLYESYQDIDECYERIDKTIKKCTDDDFYIKDSSLLDDQALTVEINGMDKEIRKRLLEKLKQFYRSGINNFIRD